VTHRGDDSISTATQVELAPYDGVEAEVNRSHLASRVSELMTAAPSGHTDEGPPGAEWLPLALYRPAQCPRHKHCTARYSAPRHKHCTTRYSAPRPVIGKSNVVQFSSESDATCVPPGIASPGIRCSVVANSPNKTPSSKHDVGIPFVGVRPGPGFFGVLRPRGVRMDGPISPS
jgi:hypothetical protein